MIDEYSQPHIYAGTEIYADFFTPSDPKFKIEILVSTTPPKAKYLTQEQKNDISLLLSNIPNIECRVVNHDFSILLKKNGTTHRLFSYYSLNKDFKETRLRPDKSNRIFPEYELARQRLEKLGYLMTEFPPTTEEVLKLLEKERKKNQK